MSVGLSFVSRRFFLGACVAVLLSSVAFAQHYTIIDLGPMSGNAVNDVTEVVGSGYAPAPNHAFLWTKATGARDQGTFPGTPPGGQYSGGVAINRNGDIIGVSGVLPSGYPHPYIKLPGKPMEDLGLLHNGAWGNAFAINGPGDVVGSSVSQYGMSSAFWWSSGTGMKALYPTRGGHQTEADGINDLGEIVGLCDIPDPITRTQVWRACLWASHISVPQSIGALPNHVTSWAHAINRSGQVVGYSASSTTWHAFLWSAHTGMIDLGVLDPGGYSNAKAINDTAEVVGYVAATQKTGVDPKYRAFVWTKAEGMKDLNHLIPSGTGWVLQFAASINSAGQISGSGVLHGQNHGFLLTPAP